MVYCLFVTFLLSVFRCPNLASATHSKAFVSPQISAEAPFILSGSSLTLIPYINSLEEISLRQYFHAYNMVWMNFMSVTLFHSS